jgi:hypothetical protein
MPDGYNQLMGALAPIRVNTLAPGVLPGAQVPLSTAPIRPANPYIQYQIENDTLSRVESEKSRLSIEPVASVVPTLPSVTLYTMPPPGYYGMPPSYPPPITVYPPVQTQRDLEYERAVQKFLEKTLKPQNPREVRYRDDRDRHDYDHRRRSFESDRRVEGGRERENLDERSRPADSSSDRRKLSSKERESDELRSSRHSSKKGKKNFSAMSADEIAEIVNVHYKSSQTSGTKCRGRKEEKGSKNDLEDPDKDNRKQKKEDWKSKENGGPKKLGKDDSRGFSPNAKKVFEMEWDESSGKEEETEPVKSKGTKILLNKKTGENHTKPRSYLFSKINC